MDDDQGGQVELPDLLSQEFLSVRKEARRLRRIAIANVLRGVRRRDGRELSDVAVTTRVPGSTPSEVRGVREELKGNGVLQDELDGPAQDKEDEE